MEATLDVAEAASVYSRLEWAGDGGERLHWRLYGPQDPERSYCLATDSRSAHE